jgi:hypothetical protein
MYLDNIDERPRWPDDAAVILSCPFPAKFGLSIAIPGHFFKVDKSESSASAVLTAEGNV